MVKKIIEETEENGLEIKQVKKESKKKAYKVVLVTSTLVIYEISPTIGNSTTPNIWGDKLKIGDIIYLPED